MQQGPEQQIVKKGVKVEKAVLNMLVTNFQQTSFNIMNV